LTDPLGAPPIPNWNRVVAAIPDFLDRLKAAVDLDQSMSESVPLQPAVLDRVRAIGSVDLLIGIPSYNNAKSIAHVVRAAVAGCAKYFPDRRAVIVNSDGGSSDGTPGVVAEADVSSLGAILVEHRLNRCTAS